MNLTKSHTNHKIMKTNPLLASQKIFCRFALLLAIMLGFSNFGWGQSPAIINVDFTGTTYSCSDGTYAANSGSATFNGSIPSGAIISSISVTVDLGSSQVWGTATFTFSLNTVNIGNISNISSTCTNGSFTASTVTGYNNTGTNTLEFTSSQSGVTLGKGVYKATLTVNFTSPQPTIVSFLPTKACSGSGESVIITGTNFSGATSVKFNGVSATIVANTGTQITTNLPTGATTGLISVTTPLGTGNSPGNFIVNTLPAFSVTGRSNISCYAGSDGTITVLASGGSGTGYTFSKDGSTYEGSGNPYTFTGLHAEVPYKIRVRDSFLCESPAIP
jgi:hypothetical protein